MCISLGGFTMDRESALSSPMNSAPSSPVQDASSPICDPASSPICDPASSPLHFDVSRSPSPETDNTHHFKKRKYEVFDPVVHEGQMKFWPQGSSANATADHHRRELFPDGDGERNLDAQSSAINKVSCSSFSIEQQTTEMDAVNMSLVQCYHDSRLQLTVPELTDTSSEDERGSESSSAEESQSDASGNDEERGNGSDNETSSSSDNHSESDTGEGANSSDEESHSGSFFSPKVSDVCDLTVDQGVLVLMDLFVKKKLQKDVVGKILKCVIKFLPKSHNMPTTQHALFEYVYKLSPVSEEITHYYCSQCQFYLGTSDKNCNLCDGDSNKFYQIPLADQIKNLFENHSLAEIIERYREERKSVQPNSYSDLLDGLEFKRVKSEGPYNITLMGHTDGISVSDSSNVSLWPLEFVIAELPPNLRFKYVLVSGIWLDERKPYMNTYLRPFKDELQNLNAKGVAWTEKNTGVVHTTFVKVPSFCADCPVRAELQNVQSHGGRHCCNLCEQKMKKLPAEPVLPGIKKKPRRRVFTFEEEFTLRTAERMDQQGKETRRLRQVNQNARPEKGVKGPSIVSDLPGCDRSTAVYPEYMHLILCLIKEFMKIWFEKNGPWSLKDHRDFINKFLESIRVPDFITRIPRSTEHFGKWKANELRSFLLYFSLVVLSQCMQPAYLQHWMLFVAAVNLLLQDVVSENDIFQANIMLRLFLRDFAELYKPDFFTYYVHNICHLPLVVQRQGPLHSNSAFMFEDFNGTLAKFIHGTKNQGKELVNSVRLAFGVALLEVRSNHPIQHRQPKVEFRNIVKNFNFSHEEKQLLSFVSLPMTVYYRAVIGREVYTTSIYMRQKKRNNFSICFVSSAGVKTFGEIKYFCQAGNDMVAIVGRFEVDHSRTFTHERTNVVIKHIIPVSRTNQVELISLDQIMFKVLPVGNYVCLRPNKHEINL